MTEQEYNAAEGIRRSSLWKMADSPEKYKWFLEHPEKGSPALIFGSAVHKLILEPVDFDKEYCVAPVVDRRTAAGKEAWKQFTEENAGKTVISQDDMNTMMAMSSVLSACGPASALLEGGQHEVPIFWTDPDTGLKCKAKMDCIVKFKDGRYGVIDYKTTTDASTETFNKHILRFGYHVQAAMYTEGLMHSLDLKYRPEFWFVAQEKKAPYSVNVIHVSEDVMNYGDGVYHNLLCKVRDCQEMDSWPGYMGIDEISNETFLPGWIESEFEDE